MNFNYRLAKKIVNYTHPLKGETETVLYGIVEVMYDKNGNVKGWTDFIDPNGWKNEKDLKMTLEYMLQAFNRPVFDELITYEK